MEAPGAGAVLHVRGSPYEMGWWQGHLLKDRIRTLHGRWRDELHAALTPGREGGQGGKALRRGLEIHCDLCVDQTIHRLSERMLQELDGIAAGCGLTKEGVVRLEVMRDALRMKGMEARLPGAIGLAREPAGYEARAWWSGADADAQGGELLLISRWPESGPRTCVVAWPGTLGALAGVNDAGLGFASVEGDVTQARRMGFGGGRPFTIAAREALEENERGYDLLAQVTGTMGHGFLAFSMRREKDMPQPYVEAIAGFHVYAAPDPPWVLDDEAYIAVAGYEVLNSPDAAALQAAIRDPQLTSDEFWLRVASHATPASDKPHAGPWMSIRFKGGRASVVFRASTDGAPQEVTLGE